MDGDEMSWHHLDFIPIKRRVRYTKNGRAYTDVRTREELAKIAASYDGPYIEGPVSLLVSIRKPTPKGVKRVIDFVTRPDADNVLKAIQDGLNGKAFKDDSQIVIATVIKERRAPGIEEGVLYEIHELGGPDDAGQ